MTERDLSDWRGIGVGYVLILCAVGGAGMDLVAPAGWDQWDQKQAGAIILTALYALWTLLKRPLRWATERLVGEDQARHEGLKNAAVVLLCVISAVVCVGLFPYAQRYSW
jgi:hypothetical protein